MPSRRRCSRSPARRCSSSAAPAPARSACTPPRWRSRSAPQSVTVRRRRRRSAARTAEALGAQTLAETPQRLGPFPVTVDSSADADGLALALRSTAPDGTCTSTAIYFGEQPSLPLLEMYTKGITFKTGRAHAREAMPHVLELAASGAIQPELVTTRTVAWDDAAEALREGDWTKLVIER